MVTLLAHQGGWDEILMVLAPIGLFAGLLFLANKRAAAGDGGEGDGDGDPEAPSEPADDVNRR